MSWPIFFHPLSKRMSIRTYDGREIGTIRYGTRQAPAGWKFFLDNGTHGNSHSAWREAADECEARLKPKATQ